VDAVDMARSIPDNVLKTASTVTVIVHGIGDHGAADITLEAVRGLEAAAHRSSSAPEAPPAVQYLDPEGAASIEFEGRTHLILPKVWSKDHNRLATRRPFGGSIYKPIDAWVYFLFFDICGSAIRCIPKAANLGWRLALMAVVAVFIGFFATIVLAVIYAQVWLWDLAHHHSVATIVLTLGLVLIAIILRGYYWSVDLVADILHYIGNPGRVEDLEKRVLAEINELADRAKHAQIVVLGHSLGSVLVTHSLLRVQETDPAYGRVVVITLGSPLATLARIFPSSVVAPSTLAKSYAEKFQVKLWGNLWRDRDFVGRKLDASGGLFIQRSVGDGSHTGMLASSVLWQRIYEIIVAVDENTIERLRLKWSSEELTEPESLEMEFRIHSMSSILIGIVPIQCLVTLSVTLMWWPAHILTERDDGPVGTLLVAAVIVLYVLSQCAALGAYRGEKSGREYLGSLRRASGICAVLTRIARILIVLPWAYTFLVWRSTAGH
jgi:hypothetical protein